MQPVELPENALEQLMLQLTNSLKCIVNHAHRISACNGLQLNCAPESVEVSGNKRQPEKNIIKV